MPPPSSPSVDAPRFRSGLPMRLAAWMSVSDRGAAAAGRRRVFSYVRLSGEVLSVHSDQFSLPLAEHDVRKARVEFSLLRRTRRDFRVVLASGVALMLKCDSFEEMQTWAESVKLASERVFAEKYELGAVVGVGSQGRSSVRYCWPFGAAGSEEAFMVKVVKRSTWRGVSETDLLEHQRLERVQHISTLLRLHSNLVQTSDVFYSVDALHIVMEDMKGGTVADLLKKHHALPEPHARAVMRNLFAALATMHEQNIVHRDVRPANLFCSEKKFPMELALGDFSEAALVDDQRVNRDVLEGMIGDPQYMAKEMVCMEKYGPAVDMWSAGVLMYHMLCGEGPFAGATTRAIFDNVRRGHVSFKGNVWAAVSADAKSLIRQLLNKDPHKRISAIAASHHNWVAGAGMPRSVSSVSPLPTQQPRTQSMSSALPQSAPPQGRFGAVGSGRLPRTSAYHNPRRLIPSASVVSAQGRYDGRLQLGLDNKATGGGGGGGMHKLSNLEGVPNWNSGGSGTGIAAFADGADVLPSEHLVPSEPSMLSVSSSSTDCADAGATGRVRSVSKMIETLENACMEGTAVDRAACRPLESHKYSSVSSSSSSSTSSHGAATRQRSVQLTLPGPRLQSFPDNRVASGAIRSMQLSGSASALSNATPSTPEADEKRRLVFTPSLRKIHESGLQAMARENPSRMRRILSSNVMQRQLSTILSYRRKLVVTSRAFIAVFRLLALVRGHSLTRQLGLVDDQEKKNWGEHVNDIVNQRKDFHDLTPQSSPEDGKDIKTASPSTGQLLFLPRNRGDDPPPKTDRTPMKKNGSTPRKVDRSKMSLLFRPQSRSVK